MGDKVLNSEYQNIQPPFTLKFRGMPKKELKNYARWFHEVTPLRIEELTKAVKGTVGFESWSPDLSPGSLDGLGEWFATQVQTRSRSQEELQEIESRSGFPIAVEDWELTNRTFSAAVDIGMYLGQVFVRNHPSLRWDQPFGSKNFADYGQPVLVEFSYAPLNCVHIAITMAYGLASKSATGKRLKELYEIWAKAVKA